jgi:hypothetical protein
MRNTQGALLLAVVLGASACGAHAGPGPSVTRAGGGIVVEGAVLSEAPADLLDAMRGRVPNFRVLGRADGCPLVVLRNAATLISPANPQVYLDGTRTMSTCLLETVRAADVERVEVYHSGTTRRAGYASHPHGLILVFTRGPVAGDPPPH